MELPELNANKTMHKIKADTRFAGIPVILPFSSTFFLKRIAKQLLIIQKDKVITSGGNAAAKVL